MPTRIVTIEGHARNRRDANSRHPTIMPQHPAEPFIANDLTLDTGDFLAGINDAVLQPLMIARRMISPP